MEKMLNMNFKCLSFLERYTLGMTEISYIQGILKRTVEPFPKISHLLEE